MNKELQTYYENRFMMFSTQGWKDMKADVERMIEATNSLSGVTVDNLQFKQGELSIMRWLLAQEEIFNQAYKELTDENNS